MKDNNRDDRSSTLMEDRDEKGISMEHSVAKEEKFTIQKRVAQQICTRASNLLKTSYFRNFSTKRIIHASNKNNKINVLISRESRNFLKIKLSLQ